MDSFKKNWFALTAIIGLMIGFVPTAQAVLYDYENEIAYDSDEEDFPGISSDIVTQSVLGVRKEKAQHMRERLAELEELNKREADNKQAMNKIQENEFYEKVLISAFATVVVGLFYFAYQDYKKLKSAEKKKLADPFPYLLDMLRHN